MTNDIIILPLVVHLFFSHTIDVFLEQSQFPKGRKYCGECVGFVRCNLGIYSCVQQWDTNCRIWKLVCSLWDCICRRYACGHSRFANSNCRFCSVCFFNNFCHQGKIAFLAISAYFIFCFWGSTVLF